MDSPRIAVAMLDCGRNPRRRPVAARMPSWATRWFVWITRVLLRP